MFKKYKKATEKGEQKKSHCDKEMFKAFLASSLLHELKHETGVLVLGMMGTGKSTLIGIQMGAVAEMNDEGKYDFTHIPDGIPDTSSGFASKTLNVGNFKDEKHGIRFFDTAGLNENRGRDIETWTKFSTTASLSLFAKVKCVAVVLNWRASIKGERGANFAKLAQCVEKVIGSSDCCKPMYENMIFILNEPYAGQDRKIKPEKVLEALRGENGFLTFANKKVEEQKQRLKELAQKNKKDRDQVTAEELPDLLTDQRVYAKELEDYEKYEALARLLTALDKAAEANPPRIFLSIPDGAKECEKQRAEVTKMIEDPKMKGVAHNQLMEIVKTRETCTLEVLNCCALIAKDCHKCLEEFNKLISAMLEALVTESEEIETNLPKALQRLEGHEDLEKAERAIDAALKERLELTDSTKRTLFRVLEVRIQKSGFWCLFRMGPKWALHEVKYMEGLADQYDGEFFDSYEIVDQGISYQPDKFQTADYFENAEHIHTIEQLDCNTDDGRRRTEKAKDESTDEVLPFELTKGKSTLKLKMISKSGKDLNVDVKLFRQEKDLPITHERIKQCLDREKKAKQELPKLREEHRSRSALAGKLRAMHPEEAKKELLKYKLAEMEETKANLDAMHSRLTSKSESIKVGTASGYGGENVEKHCLSEIMAGLHNLLNCMPKETMSGLSDSAKSQIKEFLDEHQKAEELQSRASDVPAWETFMGRHASTFAIGKASEEREVAKSPKKAPSDSLLPAGDSQTSVNDQAQENQNPPEISSKMSPKMLEKMKALKDQLEAYKKQAEELEVELRDTQEKRRKLEAELKDLD